MKLPKAQIYKAKDGWRWRFIVANGKTLADSGQGYSRRRDAIRGLVLVTGAEIWLDDDGTGSLEDASSGQVRARVEVLP